MKYLMGLLIALAFAVFISPFVIFAVQERGAFRGQNDYYIGLQRPDGSCDTTEVYATDFTQAQQIVRDKYCDRCTMKDLTFNYASGGGGALFADTTKQCPLS